MNSPFVKNGIFEKRVILGLFSILIVIEFSVRIFEDRLSGNLDHIFSIPQIVSQIDQFQKNSSIVFLGNSLTNNAIDSAIVESTLYKNLNSPVHALKVTPDGTAISDWYCIYNNRFNELKQAPTYMVIGFAWGILSDQYPNNPSRLGGFFCDVDDIDDLSVTGLTNHQQLLRFIAGATSHVYVNRERIRNRILDMLIPNYKMITQKLNQTEESRENTRDARESKYTYLLLERMITSMQSKGTQLILIAMPVIEPYEVDEVLVRLTNKMQIPILDLRDTRYITDDMFKDSIHLNEKGRLKFSQQMAYLIKQYFRKPSDSFNTSQY
ncbi:MAG: hypothetical protein OQL06_12590 [Gammaproteobacteria bacterium]|nr:hypothetical protein [Gammaproteobacteria bacterium]